MPYLLSGSLSVHKAVFHGSALFFLFSQHMDGTITPYSLFSHQSGHFADLQSTKNPPATHHPPPQNQLLVITKEEAVHPLVLHPPKCRFYSNSISLSVLH